MLSFYRNAIMGCEGFFLFYDKNSALVKLLPTLYND